MNTELQDDDIRDLVDHLNGMMDSLDESVSHDQVYGQLLLAWNMARDIRSRLSSPPADDVREALAFHLFAEESTQEEDFIRRVWANHPDEHPVKRLYFDQADAILAAFEVRPYGTVTAEAREAELRELHHFEVEQQLAETIAIVKRAQAAVLRHEHTPASLHMDSILNEVNTEIPSGSVRPHGTKALRDCECEDREALVRPEGLVCGNCGKVIDAEWEARRDG